MHKPADGEEAATMIQLGWRVSVAARVVAKLVRARWSRELDDETDTYFWYDNASGKAVWRPPAMLKRAGVADRERAIDVLDRLESVAA